MKWTLRDYQKRFCRAIVDNFREGPEGKPMRRLLGTAATGAGKTIMASALIFERQKNRKPAHRCLFLADTDELCDQAIKKIHASTGIIPDLEKAEHRASPMAGVVVGSIQSIAQPKRLKRWDPEHFQFIIADEAHLSMAASWQRVLKHFSQAEILGITATPERGDKQSLLKFYEHLAAEIPLIELIDARQLSPIVVQTAPITIPVTHRIQADSDSDEIAEDIRPYWNAVLDAIEQYAATRRKILVFHPSIKASQEFTVMAQDRGIAAEHVDGQSPDRAQIIEGFSQGRFRMLNNAQLLTKGFDVPDIDTVIVLRPTKSRTAYIQMVGRGTRIFCPHGCPEWCDHPDRKQDMLLLDFLWEFADHDVMGPADLVTDAPQQKKELAEAAKDGGLHDLFGLDREIIDKREQDLIKRMQDAARHRAQRFDARTWAAALHQPELLEYRPLAPWEHKPPTEKQIQWLEEIAVDTSTVDNRGLASKLITTVVDRRMKGMSEPTQIVELAKRGIAGGAMRYAEADIILNP